MGEVERKLQEQISEVQHRVERTETKLLTAFHKWASPTEARQRSYRAALHAFDAELDLVKRSINPPGKPGLRFRLSQHLSSLARPAALMQQLGH